MRITTYQFEVDYTDRDGSYGSKYVSARDEDGAMEKFMELYPDLEPVSCEAIGPDED